MIKKFFITFLGSMAAIWLSLLLLVALMAMGILALVKGTGEITAEVKDGTVMVIDLQGELTERKDTPTLIDVVNEAYDSNVVLSLTTDCIYRAAHDSRVSGIFLRCSGMAGGAASLTELEEAVRYFKNQPGKWVVAYGENYLQGEYLVASAGEVWLNPSGGIDLHGMSATTVFYTGLMEKLGVKMQIMRVGTFKSAVEPFMLKEISPASRMQQESYMGSVWKNVRSHIAANRGLSGKRINNLADEFAYGFVADSLKAWGLADKIGYRHNVESRVAELAHEDSFEDVYTLTPQQYATTFDAGNYSYLPGVKDGGKTIAVLYAVGEIADEGDEGIVTEDMLDEIDDLIAESDDLAGLILRVDSPGGSAMASEQIWAALEHFKDETGLPVYASMGDVAASGGYYISCGADVIYCDSTTITGSIGIFGMIPNVEGLLKNHLGITTSTVNTNRNSDFPNIVTPMTPEQVTKMQAAIERGYDLFTRRVAQGRQMSQDSVKLIAEGRVWSGAQALGNGLADRAGSLRQAILGMAGDLGLDSYQVKCYPRLTSKWWETLLTLDEDVTGKKLEAVKAIKKIRELQKAPRIQCRMEDIIVN